MRWPRPSRASRPARRRPRDLERLEGRALLSGDIWVSNEVPGLTSYHLMHYSQSGALLGSVAIPKGSGNTDSPTGRGLAFDQDGNIELYNGTFLPVLSTYSPTKGTWSDQTFPGWSTVNNVSYGGVAAYQHYIFASDMRTFGDNLQPATGIVRFDLSGGPAVRFADNLEFTKVTVGLDGLLYGLGGINGQDIAVYDLQTLAPVRTLALDNAPDADIRGIAVDAQGDIFTATWGGYIAKYDPSGKLLASIHPGGNEMDIALDTDGQIVTGDWDGVIRITDTSLSSVRSFSTGQWNGFVAFDHYINVTASVAPVANAGGPYSVPEGGTVQLDASNSSDPNANPGPLTYLWDLNGNGVFGETGPAATRGDETGVNPVYSAAGLPGASAQTVQLKVVNSKGQSSTTSAEIDVANQAPTVNAGPDASIAPGDTFAGQGSFSDPGAGETYTATVDYGDGAGPQALTLNTDHTFSLSHAYASGGNYTVTVRVSDGHDTGSDTLNVAVSAAGSTPVFDSLAGASITYGDPSVTLGGRISVGGAFPSGSVEITLAGLTRSAPIDPTTGQFSAVFDTAKLGVQSSPYAIIYHFPGDGTFDPIADTSQSLIVQPRALTVTAQDASKTYGDDDPAFSAAFDGFIEGDDASTLGGSLSFATDEPAGNAPVGQYTIAPSGLTSTNYAITFAPGTLTVTPRALTVTAQDATKTYGDQDPSFTATYSGFAPDEDASVLGGALGFTTDEPGGNAPVGQYAITPGGLTSANYDLTFVPGALTVTARSLTVAARDASKVYGDPDPAFAVNYQGLAPGDDTSALDGALSFATDEPAGNAPVSHYTITPSGLTSPNYAITFAPGTLSVTPRTLTVTAQDATKAYADRDPAFDVAFSGFAPKEDPSVLGGLLTFATNEPTSGNAPVGRYTITPSGLTSTNYAIAFVPGTLSVTPRTLNVTAQNASKTYGQPDPAFGVAYSGFADGEDASALGGTLTFSTNEPTTGLAPAGTYAITPGGLISTNYAVAFAPGRLTVNQAVTSLGSLASPTIVVGAPLNLTGRVGSNSVLPSGQIVSVTIVGANNSVVASGSGTIGANGTFSASINSSAVPGGVYTIRYAYAGDHNFTASAGTGTLTVSYAINPLYDQAKAQHGRNVQIRLQVTDAAGNDLSSDALTVTAFSLLGPDGTTTTPRPGGNPHNDNQFKRTGRGYDYTLDTKGLAPGTYTLYVQVGNDPALHALKIILA